MEKIRIELERVNYSIGRTKEALTKEVEAFKECVATYDADHIAMFAPGFVERTAKLKAKLQKLEEQKSMLMYLLGRGLKRQAYWQ